MGFFTAPQSGVYQINSHNICVVAGDTIDVTADRAQQAHVLVGRIAGSIEPSTITVQDILNLVKRVEQLEADLYLLGNTKENK